MSTPFQKRLHHLAVILVGILALSAVGIYAWALLAHPYGDDSVGVLLKVIEPLSFGAVAIGVAMVIYNATKKNSRR